ncbi:MAG: 2-oxoacid:acceptor oxidoreductase subunit alpha [Desulfohalobiaceae bacterium]
MSKSAIQIRIGGEAGQGLETMGQLLARGLVRSGYEILVSQNYMSRIRGGHNFFSVVVDNEPVLSPAAGVDLLVAMNRETVTRHREELRDGGCILADASQVEENAEDVLAVPFSDLVPEKLYTNTAALGSVTALLRLDLEVFKNLLREVLGAKSEDAAEKNADAFTKGRTWILENSRQLQGAPSPAFQQGDRFAMSGNQAIALGAMAAGANFCSFYPMTPSTGVALNLAAQAEELGIVAEQAEDEIAAVNMAIGASFAGAKSLVPTSGGGFSLMAEGISLAGMTETPLVIVLGQRPGPATGLPTRTEQGDLQIALYSGHGEFPRAVFTPGTPEECFDLTYRALDLAERSQSPAIVMTDQYLADSIRAVAPFSLNDLPETARPAKETEDPEAYVRYAFNSSGVSERLLPGTGTHLVVADSDEHTPDGHITEDLSVRTRMVDKRLAKRRVLEENAVPPEADGPEEPELLFITWGSSKGAVLQAASDLRKQGRSVGTLHFRQVCPLVPEQFLTRLRSAGRTVCVEGNATGQLAQLIRQETGFAVDHLIHRYDGLPMDAETIHAQLD